ncbi:DNA-binding response regulator [Luteitalea sp. TBR-22]|uniref:response regulator n=1 Tax=Luteitalea sp. TBR-22 TaxID=2802971 RepID=UPI001AF13CE4|nr:response regulator transcription factor [Luteitalea sp. TBR-22]BCS35534.1 DNA-binding response regulator [Luteitalea sp. TBR-22]
MRPRRFRILLADDHPILAESLRVLLSQHYEVVGSVTDGHALLKAAEEMQPDIIVSDIAMPGLNGLDAATRLRQKLPRVRLLFLTMTLDQDVAAEAIRRGADAYVVKSAPVSELFEAIGQVLDGRPYITPAITEEPAGVFIERAQKAVRSTLTVRQREVLQLLAEGRSMKEAAAVLDLTPRTIAFHKYSMMEQLGVKTTAALIQHAVALGLVTPGSRA